MKIGQEKNTPLGSISSVLWGFDILHYVLEKMRKKYNIKKRDEKNKNQKLSHLTTCIDHAHGLFLKYYKLTDETEVYVVAMVLDPRQKYRYFFDNWERKYHAGIKKKIETMYKEFYIDDNAATSTIRRWLREELIWKWRAVKPNLLNKDCVKKCLEWAMEYKDYMQEDWAKFAWSDESIIQKDSARQQVWVFRHQTKEEKYAPKNIRGKARDGDIFQMVWGCFVGNKLGPIVSIDGSITDDKYVSLLQENLLSYLDALAADDITGITFQQDNARLHVC